MAGVYGIATYHRDRRHRSRLEARYSRFFDLMRWKHEYEPFDLGGWIPDFIIGKRLLVEVKPFALAEDWSEEVEIICRAMQESKRAEDVLLLGCYGPEILDDSLSLGFILEKTEDGVFDWNIDDTYFGATHRGITFDVSARAGSWKYRVENLYTGAGPYTDAATIGFVEKAWATAGNDTQWMAR